MKKTNLILLFLSCLLPVSFVSAQKNDGKSLAIYENNLAKAVAAIGTTVRTTLVVEADAAVGSVVTIPKNIVLDFQKGARLTKSGAAGKLICQGVCFDAPDNVYRQIFQGFSAGDIIFSGEMPNSISPVWFGAQPMTTNVNDGAVLASNVDTLPIVNLIAAAFAKTGQEGKMQGSTIEFPCSDFYFSDTWIVSKAFAVKGCRSNNFWSHGTRLVFASARDGIYVKSAANERPNGNIFSGFEIRAIPTYYTDSVVNINGLNLSYVSGSNFAQPLTDGSTVSLDGGAFTVIVRRPQRTAGVGSNSSGATTFLTSGANFTNADVGADLQILPMNFQATVVSVKSGNSVVISKPLPSATAAGGQGLYITSAKTLNIDKPEFSLFVSPPTTQDAAKGSQLLTPLASDVNVSPLIVGQPIILYNGGLTCSRTVSAVVGKSVQITPQLCDNFVANPNSPVLGTVQSLATAANRPARLNKWAAINCEDCAGAIFEDIRALLFAGDAFKVDTNQFIKSYAANSNNATFRNVVAEQNAGNAYHGIGQNSNAILLEQPNFINNRGCGIWDEGYLGINVVGGHITDNVTCSVWTKHNSTNASVLTGVYFEGGEVPVNLGAGNVIIGGQNGIGFHPLSQESVGINGGDISGGAGISGGGLVFRNTTGTLSAKLFAQGGSNLFLRVGGQGGRGSESTNTITDWAMANGDMGNYGYITDLTNANPNGYTLAWDTANHAALARKLRIGDGSGNYNNYTEMTSITAKPTTGVYPLGAIVWNRNYTTGAAAGWINKTAGTADFEPIGSGSKTFTNFVNLTPFTPKSSADASGAANDVARDDNYIYVKTSTGWKRTALSNF